MNSRDKGKRGELELAAFLREHGFPARRGQQFHGGAGSPDVVAEGLEDVHLECKRTEQIHLDDWLAQAQRDAGDKLPVIAFKRNRGQWVAMLPLDRFLELMLGVGHAQGVFYNEK